MARTTRGILAVVAEAERLNAVARMERGKRRRAERGHLSGSSNPLFGYDWVDDEPGKRTAYVESPDTGPVVRRIFELAKADKTMRGIAMLLNDEGVSTPSQVSATNGHLGRHKVGARWTAETIRRILTDRTYLGEGAAYKWQRTRSTNGRVGHARRAEDDAMRVTLTVPALVDPDTFAVVQRNMASHKPSGRPPIDGEASWLRGHVYCGVCGARMFLRRSSRDGAMVYRCRQSAGSSNDGVDCPGGSFSIRANVLDPIAYEAVEGVVGRLEPLRTALLRSVRGDMTTRWAAMAESYEVQLKRKREELETARRRARQTSDDELAAMFMRDAEELNKAVHQLEQDYAAAREELEKVNAEAAWVDSVLERIKAHKHIPANETNERLSFEDRRHLLDATGLYLAVYPKNWREDGKRVDVRYRWMYDPKDPRVLMSRPSPGWRRYSARCP